MSKFLTLPAGLALTAGLFLASTVVSQTSLTWVKDINTNPNTTTSPSYPSPNRSSVSQNYMQWAMIGSTFYFSATTSKTGYELFKSDGTAKGTTLIKDINPGATSSSPYYFEVVGTQVFFRANDGKNGYELWVTDGTATGTKMVKDIYPGASSSSPYNFARVGTKVVFRANDGKSGYELWVSDGTAAGTILLADIYPGTSSSSPSYCKSTFIGHKVFFYANDGKVGSELWVTDGTPKGTILVKDIYVGTSSNSSYPRYFQHLGATQVVFEANDGKNGYELWISDGTPAGTTLVKDVYVGASTGTSLYSATSLGGKVLFRGYDGLVGYEPWITDGTTKGTMLLKDVRVGTGSSYMYYSSADAGLAYWGCSATAGSYEIWVTDGTPANTKRFSKAAMSTSTPSYLTATGGMVFFQGNNVTASTGYEICMTDGITTATVKDIRVGTSSGYSYYCSPIAKGVVAFAADDGKNGRELWISTGKAATTFMIDINPPVIPAPTASDNVQYIESFFGKVVFGATDGTDKTKGNHGQELWISDGTTAGTKLLKDIYVGTSTTTASSSYPYYMCRLGNYIYFRANDGTNGVELWRTDGTTTGTKLFKDIYVGTSSSYPYWMTRIGDKIYFYCNNGTNGNELWVCDGTVAGTKMVKDIYPGTGSSSPRYFARLGLTNKCVFSAYDGTATTGTGYELWITDGTAAGTKLVKDIRPGTSSSYPYYMRSMGDKVYFECNNGTVGSELWETDGTSAGTKLVKDLYPGASSGYARYIAVQHKGLYFYSYSTTAGYEVSTSDGTATGTKLYWDLNPGTASTYPYYITAVGSRRIYFRGESAAYGAEPVFMDVTNKTVQYFNANPAGHSYPYNLAGGHYGFAVDNGYVYTRATAQTITDYQLLKIQNGATAQSIGRAQASSLMTATDPIIGKNMTIAGVTGVTNPLTVLCLGVPDSMPKSLGTFAPDSYAYFQLTNYFMIIGNYPGKAWGSVFGIPNDTTLLGYTAVLQGYSLNSLTFPASTEVTNGIHITMGK